MKFSAKQIENLKPREARYEIWEDDPAPGLFGVRVSPTGGISWQFKYFLNGKQRRATIGRYRKNLAAPTEMTLAQARARCAEMRAAVAVGVDPGAELVVERKAEREAPTVEDMVEDHVKVHIARLRTAAETERYLRTPEVRTLYRLKAKDVTRRDLSAVLNTILARAPYAANRTYSHLRKLFDWGDKNGYLENNPFDKMEKPFADEVNRDRHLTDDEIARFWNGLDTIGAAPVIKDVMRVLMLTAARRGEVAGMRWDEFDGDVWNLPAARTKSKKARAIPLSPFALEIIERQPRKGEFVFNSPRADGPLDGPAIGRALRRNLEVLELTDFRLHDIRRTAATALQRLGVDYVVIQKILGHSLGGGATEVYARHNYGAEMRTALERLADHIEALASDGPKAEVVAI